MLHIAPLLLTLAAAGLSVNGVDRVVVHGNQYTAAISTQPSGYKALLILTFDSPRVDLDATSLDIVATEVDPAVLRSRLPAGVFLPARFPVVIQVHPGSDPQTAATFDNGFTVEIATRNLEHRAHTPLRLFKAPDGGAFEDISFSLGSGSFRARGSAGSFSEFVLAADLRQPKRVIEGKYASVQKLLDENEGTGIAGATYALLDKERDASWDAYLRGDLTGAVDHAEAMLAVVEAQAGRTIEARYEGGDDVSLAGVLTGAVSSLRAAVDIEALGVPEETEVVSTDLTTKMGRKLTVRLAFGGRQALDLEQLDIHAEDVDPKDPKLLARIPNGVTIPEEFPVLIHVDPGSNDEQAFRGNVSYEVETDDIDFLTSLDARLFKAPDGEAFEDITRTYGLGSFRARGSSGSFSELMLLRDRRDNKKTLTAKFQALNALLRSHRSAIDSDVYSDALTLLDAARSAYQDGDLDTAKAGLEDFAHLVEAESGNGVPDIWVSTGGVQRDNVAAELLGAAQTTSFNLGIERSPAPDGYTGSPPNACDPFSDTAVCLNGGRFRVSVKWRNRQGQVGNAMAVPYGSDDTGMFYFFGRDNWEMLVKVLDGCGLTKHYWVFSAATTNVEYTLRVVDTQANVVKEYFNPLESAAPAITDTMAFATCP